MKVWRKVFSTTRKSLLSAWLTTIDRSELAWTIGGATRTQAGQFPVEQDLDKVNARTLIIWGAEDALIPLAAGRTMNSLIKDSKLVIIEKCGHVPQEEMPERVLYEMTKFIEKERGA